jgi:hypothetical protein
MLYTQALSLLEHLVKSGTERVVEDARDHLHRYIHTHIYIYIMCIYVYVHSIYVASVCTNKTVCTMTIVCSLYLLVVYIKVKDSAHLQLV